MGEASFLAGRNAGRFRFVETALRLKNVDLRKAHRISDEIEALIHREAPFFAFLRLTVETGEAENREVLANPVASIPKGKGVRVAEWLIERKTDQVRVREPLKGKGPGYALESAGVEVKLTEAAELMELVESFKRIA